MMRYVLSRFPETTTTHAAKSTHSKWFSVFIFIFFCPFIYDGPPHLSQHNMAIGDDYDIDLQNNNKSQRPLCVLYLNILRAYYYYNHYCTHACPICNYDAVVTRRIPKQPKTFIVLFTDPPTHTVASNGECVLRGMVYTCTVIYTITVL